MKPMKFNEGSYYRNLYIKTDDDGFVLYALYKESIKSLFSKRDIFFIKKHDITNELTEFISGQEITDELLDLFIFEYLLRTGLHPDKEIYGAKTNP